MKNLIKLLVLGIICTTFCATCNDIGKNDINEPSKEQTLKDKLIGKWTELSPCEKCKAFTFLQNDSIYQTVKSDDTTYSLSYVVINNDSIQVTRNWDIEQAKKQRSIKLFFCQSIQLKLINFCQLILE